RLPVGQSARLRPRGRDPAGRRSARVVARSDARAAVRAERRRPCDPHARPRALHGRADQPVLRGRGGEGARRPHDRALAGRGQPNYYIEYHTGDMQAMMTHLMSFVVHGVFERYPTLKLAFLESGFTWLPAFLLRFDTNYKGLRREVPWVKRRPTEYVRDHMRF